MIAEINVKKCRACGICIDTCPMSVFSWRKVNGKKTIVVDNPGACISCGACVIGCPHEAIKLR